MANDNQDTGSAVGFIDEFLQVVSFVLALAKSLVLNGQSPLVIVRILSTDAAQEQMRAEWDSRIEQKQG